MAFVVASQFGQASASVDYTPRAIATCSQITDCVRERSAIVAFRRGLDAVADTTVKHRGPAVESE